MRHHRVAVSSGLGAVLLFLALASGVSAGPATDRLRPEIDRVITLLDNPALQGAERRQAIRGATDSIFDWAEMARRALGRHWEARSEAEQQEFVGLFRDLLERAYISKIERYNGEKIVYGGESVDGEYASVRTRLVTARGQDVAMEYRLMRRAERWMVYDVVIEGISLVGNYRTQFDGIIRTSSYQELVKRIRTRAS